MAGEMTRGPATGATVASPTHPHQPNRIQQKHLPMLGSPRKMPTMPARRTRALLKR